MKYRYVLVAAIAFLRLGSGPSFARAQSHQPSSQAMGFKAISHAESYDWLAVSPEGTMIAIVHTVLAAETPPIGKSLEVYSLNGSEPQRELFTDTKPHQLITELQWVGDSLLYCTIQGFDSLQQYGDWQEQPRLKRVEPMLAHIQTKLWRRGNLLSSTWGQVKLSPPGIVLPCGKNKGMVFDDLRQMSQSDGKDFSTARYLSVYSVPEGVVISNTKTDGPMPNYRWWGGPKRLVPLFISSTGQQLIALVSSGYKWSERKHNVPFVISIDLITGLKHAITPDSDLNGLSIPGDPQDFCPGNPMRVQGQNQAEMVACNLDRSEASHELAFRFGYFNLDGRLLNQKLVFQNDLLHAGIPLQSYKTPDGKAIVSSGRHLTWAPDGKSVLLQIGAEVWWLELDKLQAKRVAQGIFVEDIISWIGKNQLLVRARYSKIPPTSGERPQLVPRVWGFIDISG